MALNQKSIKNLQAVKWLYYTITCSVIAIILLFIIIAPLFYEKYYYDVHDVFGDAIVVLIVLSVDFTLCLYLTKKSKEDYTKHYLISPKLIKWFKLTTEYRKRLVMTFLIYPLFAITPIPIVGSFFLGFYIIPATFIMWVIYVVIWIRDGKILDSNMKNSENNAKLYCKHCGKLIDAKSKFCQYCGKEQ